jgi:hypothetical protein
MRCTIFVAVMAACLGVASAQQALTNSSIVQMVKAGLSESVVVDAIHNQPHQFSLSAPDLIALKQAGVSDAILAAMLTATTPPPAPSVTPAPAIKSITDVRTILIDGNNEAASNARNDLLKIASKHPNRACFKPVGVRRAADAILEIAESDTAGGSGGIFGGTNLETTVASGTLTDAAGDLLWSNSKQGVQGVFHTGAGDAAQMLLLPLYIAAGCDRNGLRQTSESPTSEAAPATPQSITWVRKLYLTGSKERAIKGGKKQLETFTCIETVGDPAEADAIVVLEQSSDAIPRGAMKSLYSRATVESKTSKTALWSYDEGDVFQPGHKGGVHTWWEQLNEAVGCGKAGKHKEGKWPAAQAKP